MFSCLTVLCLNSFGQSFSIPSILQSSKIYMLFSIYIILKNRCRMSGITRSIGIQGNIGLCMQSYFKFLFFSRKKFLDFFNCSCTFIHCTPRLWCACRTFTPDAGVRGVSDFYSKADCQIFHIST